MLPVAAWHLFDDQLGSLGAGDTPLYSGVPLLRSSLLEQHFNDLLGSNADAFNAGAFFGAPQGDSLSRYVFATPPSSPFLLAAAQRVPVKEHRLFTGAHELLVKKGTGVEVARMSWELARGETVVEGQEDDAFNGMAPPPGTPLGDLLQELASRERNELVRLTQMLSANDLIPAAIKLHTLRMATARFAAVRDKILDASARMCVVDVDAAALMGVCGTDGAAALALAPAGAADSVQPALELAEKTEDDDEDEPDGKRQRRPKRSVTATAANHERMAAAREAMDDEDTPLGAAATKHMRDWLFDHFLHPYPTDADKKAMAKVTGLKRIQVSNWFINARVRIWRPTIFAMCEEIEGGPEGADEVSAA